MKFHWTELTFEFSLFQAVLEMDFQISFWVKSFSTFGASHVILFVMNFRMAIELKFGGKWFATKFTSLLPTISHSDSVGQNIFREPETRNFLEGRVLQNCTNVLTFEIVPYLLRFYECNPNGVFLLFDHWKLHHKICTSTETRDPWTVSCLYWSESDWFWAVDP